MKITDAVRARFWAKVAIGSKNDCWPFLAFIDKDGYGRFSIDGNDMSAQRAAWIVAVGPIPAGLHVLHDCDNPPCCNPDHLFLGTHADNMRDAASKKRIRSCPKKGADSPKRQMTHCRHGHLYDEANTAWSRAGHRVCRACMRAHTAKHRAAKKPAGYKYVHYHSAQTHCAQGHPFNEANTYWHRGKWRQCRECNNARRRKKQAS